MCPFKSGTTTYNTYKESLKGKCPANTQPEDC